MSSSTSQIENQETTQTIEEPERVRLWRELQLVRAGYSFREADLLASDLTVDLHKATDLLDNNCPTYLAVAILLQ